MSDYKASTAEEARLLSHIDSWDKTTGKGKYDSRKLPVTEEVESNKNDDDTSQNAPDDAMASSEDTQAEKSDNSKDTSKTTSSSDDGDVTHDWEKRAKDSQRYISQLKEKQKLLEDEKSNLETKLSKTEIEALPKTKEELEAYRKKNPELYDVLISMVGENAAKRDEILSKQLEDIQRKTTQMEKSQRLSTLLEKHPDALELQSDSKFGEWLDVQPDSIRALVESDNVESVSLGIEKYKKDMGIIDTPKSKRKKKATQDAMDTGTTSKSAPDVNTDGKKRWKESEILKKSQEDKFWFEKHMSEIDEANREGRVDYDISGGM